MTVVVTGCRLSEVVVCDDIVTATRMLLWMTVGGRMVVGVTGGKGWLQLWLIQEIFKLEERYHRSQCWIATVTALMTRRGWLMDSRMTVGFMERLMRTFLVVLTMRCVIRMLLLTNDFRRQDWGICESIHDTILWWLNSEGHEKNGCFLLSSLVSGLSHRLNHDFFRWTTNEEVWRWFKAWRLNWPSSQLPKNLLDDCTAEVLLLKSLYFKESGPVSGCSFFFS